MSQAEYFSKPFPLVAKLASLLRNNAAVQFVFARFAGLLRSNKSRDEPLVSPFLDEMPGVRETPSGGELPGIDIPSLDLPSLEIPSQVPDLGETPNPDERPSPGEVPSTAELPLAAPEVSDEPAVAVESDRSEREKLIRRRWAETGIKMWNADVQSAGHGALTIQGHTKLLPARPGTTRREYDRLEFKLIAGQIACEGVVVDPPKRRN